MYLSMCTIFSVTVKKERKKGKVFSTERTNRILHINTMSGLLASATAVTATGSKIWSCKTFDESGSNGRREKNHKINLKHNSITGNRFVLLDGIEIPGTRGSTTPAHLTKEPHVIEFPIDNMTCTILIRFSSNGFNYTCKLGEEILTESRNQLETLDATDIIPKVVLVPNFEASSSTGKIVINYKVVVVIGTIEDDHELNILSEEDLGTVEAGHQTYVYRRYNDFERLAQRLKGAYKGSHLLTSLPSLPGKVINPFVDQTSPDFLNTRKRELEQYLKKVIEFPKANKNIDVLKFLGLDPLTAYPLDPNDAKRMMECKF